MPEKFGFSPSSVAGSPHGGKIRTFFTFTILAGALDAAPQASRLAYYFEGAAPPRFFEPQVVAAHSSRLYRNPIALAYEWHGVLATGQHTSRADFARKLGVSRARVTQVLGLLALAPALVQALVALGDPLPKPVVTERSLRSILKLPINEQKQALRRIADEAASS